MKSKEFLKQKLKSPPRSRKASRNKICKATKGEHIPYEVVCGRMWSVKSFFTLKCKCGKHLEWGTEGDHSCVREKRKCFNWSNLPCKCNQV